MENKDDAGQPGVCVCVVVQTDGGAEPTRSKGLIEELQIRKEKNNQYVFVSSDVTITGSGSPPGEEELTHQLIGDQSLQ